MSEIILQSNRLLFRKITPDDFDELAVMLTNPKVMYAWEHTFSPEQITEWIDRQLQYYETDGVGYFAAITKADGAFVGQMGLHRSTLSGKQILEVCYILKEQYFGKGYALEGARALVNYAHTQMREPEVYAEIRTNNLPSLQVAERLRMTRTGSFIKHYNGIDMEHQIYVSSAHV